MRTVLLLSKPEILCSDVTVATDCALAKTLHSASRAIASGLRHAVYILHSLLLFQVAHQENRLSSYRWICLQQEQDNSRATLPVIYGD